VARLSEELLERVEAVCDRVLDLAEALDKQRRPRRIVSQIIGSGTSVGANVFEADEAMTRPEFARCLAIAVRELNETRFWIRLVIRREWIPGDRLAALLDECDQLKRILGTIIARTRNDVSKQPSHPPI